MRKIIGSLLLLPLLRVDCFASNCEKLRPAFQQLNQTIVVRGKDDAKRITPDLVVQTRPKLQSLTEMAIRSSLMNEPAATAGQLRDEIQCIQGQARAEQENPDLPYAIPISGPQRRYLVAYVINGGGEGIPDSIPSVALWSLASTGWQPRYVDTSLYVRSSFSISKIRGASNSEANFLLAGKEYGDTGSRLKLTLLHVDAQGIKSVWKVFDYDAGSVSVKGHRIIIRYLPDRRADVYKIVSYDVSPEGVPKLVTRPS